MMSKTALKSQSRKSDHNRVERSVEGYLNNFDFQYAGHPLNLAPDVALFEVPKDEIKLRESSAATRHVGDASATWKVLEPVS